MKRTIGKYSEEAKNLLSGKIRELDYTADVLKELEKKRIHVSASWIRLVVNEKRDNDPIWDAVKAVLEVRKQKEQQIKKQIKSLTEEVKELVDA